MDPFSCIIARKEHPKVELEWEHGFPFLIEQIAEEKKESNEGRIANVLLELAEGVKLCYGSCRHGGGTDFEGEIWVNFRT